MKRKTAGGQTHQRSGFSSVELSVVLAVMSLVAGFALLNFNGIMPGMRASAALDQTMGQLRSGRELAIAQRRNIELKFLGTNQIQLIRQDVPAGTTTLSTVTLENGTEFHSFADIPDTPDGFGKTSAVDFGGATMLMFLSDGTLVDAQANPVNGTVFLGLPGHPETARAVTVLGATGRVRSYQWSGAYWLH